VWPNEVPAERGGRGAAGTHARREGDRKGGDDTVEDPRRALFSNPKFSIPALRACPRPEVRQGVRRRVIRGSSISVNSTLSPLGRGPPNTPQIPFEYVSNTTTSYPSEYPPSSFEDRRALPGVRAGRPLRRESRIECTET